MTDEGDDELVDLVEAIAHDVSTIKGIAVAFFIVLLLGVVASIVAAGA